MRICLVSLDYKPFRSSGLTVYAEDLAKGLQEAGQSVTVLAAQHTGLPGHHWVDGIEVYRVPSGGLNWISYSLGASRLLKHLQQNKPWDVIHFLDVHFAYAYQDRFIGSVWQSFHQRLTANAGQPYNSGTLDRIRRQFYYRMAKMGMEQPAVNRSGRLVASCQSTLNEFVANYGVRPQHIDLVHQGIDVNSFKRVPSEHLRKQLGLDNLHIILSVGFLTPRKGIEYLGQALQRLPQDVHVLIVGAWEKGYHRVFCESLGEAATRVHELGYIADEDRPAYYSLADVYVSPSILEGLGITPIEAMACSTPAIVTDASSGPEEVGEAGVVVPARDPVSLAHAISHLLEDPELRRSLGQAGRQRVEKLFSHTNMAAQTQLSYNKFLSLENQGGG